MVKRKRCQVLVSDIREEQPLEPAVLPLGDRLTSSLCLEAVCAALGATAELCSVPQALWCSAEARRSAFYTVGDKRFPALALEEEFFVRPCRRRRHDKEAGEGSAGS